MATSIGPPWRYENRTVYSVQISGETIVTTVTACPYAVGTWIREVTKPFDRRRPIVGRDIISNPPTDPTHTNPIAIIQICIGSRCLVYQKFGPEVPRDLADFLAERNNILVGVGITSILDKLADDCGIGRTAFSVELGSLAAFRYGQLELLRATLREPANLVGMKDFNKPRVAPIWDYQSFRVC